MSRSCSRCGTDTAADATFCRACGARLVAARGAAPPIGLAIAVAAVAVALGAGGFWWLGASRSASLPSFDSAPPPSVLGGRSAAASAAAAGDAPSGTPVAQPAPSPQAVASEPTSSTAAVAKVSRSDTDKAARDDKATAVREQRAQVASGSARRRADARRARAASSPAPAAPSVPASAPASPAVASVPAPPSPLPRSVQERCANRNPLLLGLCESRECMHAEHSGEAVCQRIKAADDRRREQ